MTGLRPWQADWKHPEWKTSSSPAVDDTTTSDSASRPPDNSLWIIGSTSAQISQAEIPGGVWEQFSINNHDNLDDEEPRYYTLTVTLFSKAPDDTQASELTLEILDEKDCKVLHNKRLLWPEGILDQEGNHDDDDDDENATNVSSASFWQDLILATWLPFQKPNQSSTRSRRGIVSATLCRSKKQTATGDYDPVALENATDALDAIAWMGLGLEVPVALSNSNSSTSLSEQPSASQQDPRPTLPTEPSVPLYLACVTPKGFVAIYSPWELLTDYDHQKERFRGDDDDDGDGDGDGDDKLHNEMTKLFFGSELFATIQDVWKPLCQPTHSTTLSILESASARNRTTTPQDASEDQSDNSTSFSTPTKCSDDQPGLYESPPKHSRKVARTRPSLWDADLWNPLLEPWTLPHRTSQNQVTQIQTAGHFLVALGTGTCRVVETNKTNRRQYARDSETDGRSNKNPWWQDSDIDPSRKWPDEEKRRSINKVNQRDRELAEELPDFTLGDFTTERPWWASSTDLEQGRITPLSTHNAGSVATNSIQQNKMKIDTTTATTAKEGGFITFISMAHWSETRTLFLPFRPKSATYISEWNSMELILVMGDQDAWAIRMDVSLRPVSIGPMREAGTTEPQQPKNNMWIHRFQAIPVILPVSETSGPTSRLLCASADSVQPPALLELYTEEQQPPGRGKKQKDAVGGILLLKTFKSITSTGRIELTHAPGHVARIPEPNASLLAKTTSSFVGQGWSLFATANCVYWICWEGATASRGVAFVEALPDLAPSSNNYSFSRDSDSKRLGCFVSKVLPFEIEVDDHLYQDTRSGSVHLPFSEPYDSSTLAGEHSKSPGGSGDSDIVVEALESLSTFTFRGEDLLTPDQGSSSIIDRDMSRAFSYREKSERLLRQCSSWTQLESTRDNRVVLERQVPVISLRLGTVSTPHRILTLRHLTVMNGRASPYQQVLSWLCNRHDFFTAASIALDLLNDPESLYHLWKHAEKIDEEDEQNKLDGLLDGIIPIRTKTGETGSVVDSDDSPPSTPLLVQLADMTVGCLTKGGLAMSKTLKKFLEKDKNYDPARACLMLAAATANAVSDDSPAAKDEIGDGDFHMNFTDLLWPVQCLLQIGVARDYLSTCLVLLNVTIPDELRRRPRQGTMKMSTPSMTLTKSLVTLVLTCGRPDAVDLLLGLVDDHSRGRFWESLDHETRLALALIDIDKKSPLLKQPEVRAWVREELHKTLKDNAVDNSIPTDWLRTLAVACLHNAGCDLSDFSLQSDTLLRSSDPANHDDDRLHQHKIEIMGTRNALISGGAGGVDFDLLIPCLLLLQHRRALWRGDGENVSTQSLLDATCYLAGRDNKNHEEEILFDGPTAMRQCALAGNVRAAANLIGGTNGFVLSCCDILMVEMQVSMEDAERFLLDDRITLDIVEKSEQFHSSTFELTDSHRELLWMLDEHVLSIRTFGEFETTHLRGRVDPVFCSRSILRAWLCLTYSVREHGSAWLVRWLRLRLGIQDDSKSPSPHRLACAALTRALVWGSKVGLSADDAIASGQMLGHMLGLEHKFLLELSFACCGLVESVPAEVAEEVVKQAEMPGTKSSVLDGMSRIHLDL